MFPTDYSVDPGTFARMAEERGFESVFFPEHTHIPVSRDTPYPGGGELPPEYSHTHDLFVALAAAAAATEDRKSTRLNSSHSSISYAVFCLKKKKSESHTSSRTST